MHPTPNASPQRLTDAEIGDAAAICCRFVVLVIDAYMQMCANLHKHDETEVGRVGCRLQARDRPRSLGNPLDEELSAGRQGIAG